MFFSIDQMEMILYSQIRMNYIFIFIITRIAFIDASRETFLCSISIVISVVIKYPCINVQAAYRQYDNSWIIRYHRRTRYNVMKSFSDIVILSASSSSADT